MKKKRTMNQKVISWLAMSLAITLLATTMGFTTSAKTVSENAVQTGTQNTVPEGTPANPVHHCNAEDDLQDTTTWSYVYFGSYPQTEVTDSTIISAIDSAISSGNGIAADAGTDVWIDCTKYRRISKKDTNYDGYFDWVTNNGYRYFKWERIKWRVLKNDGTTLFVLADRGLDCKDYHDDGGNITWENSTVRDWLNNSFYTTAFSTNEQSAIVTQNVVNDDNSYGGNNTNDNVYLLSIGEVTNADYGFCSDYSVWSASRWMQPSNYAHARGTATYSSGSTGNIPDCDWWLRSPGYYNGNAAYVDYDGGVDRSGAYVNYGVDAVVPALHINLSSNVWSMTDDGTSGEGGEDWEIVQTPKADIAGGTYNAAQTVTLSTQTAGAEIYYTLDGSEPDGTNGTKYTTPITIDKSLTLKAIAIKKRMKDSEILTEEYVILTSVPEDKNTSKTENYPAIEEAEKQITSTNTDKGDVAASKFASLQLKAIGKNKSVKLTWKKVKDADGYIIYGAKCGKSMKKIKTLKGNKKVSYTQKKLKKGKYYKYMVVAYKNVNGKKCTIATSKSAHAVTNGGKYGNPTKVSVKSSKMTIKKGRTKTIKASYTLPKGKKASIHIAKFRYESSNTKIATVSKKGVVKGKAKGTAYIYVYAQNGVYKKVKVTVK